MAGFGRQTFYMDFSSGLLDSLHSVGTGFPQSEWSKRQGWHCKAFCEPLGVTHHYFSSTLLVMQVRSGSLWEETTWGCKHKMVKVVRCLIPHHSWSLCVIPMGSLPSISFLKCITVPLSTPLCVCPCIHMVYVYCVNTYTNRSYTYINIFHICLCDIVYMCGCMHTHTMHICSFLNVYVVLQLPVYVSDFQPLGQALCG